MSISKKILVGGAGLWLLGAITVFLWFASSYAVFYIVGTFFRGVAMNGLHVAWALIGILVADGLLMIAGVHYGLRVWMSRRNRTNP